MEEVPDTNAKLVVLDNILYTKTITNNYTIKSAAVVGDSLVVEVTSSGCSGSSWVLKAIDSEVIAESYPIQRFMKISLDNKELCLAVITKRVSFDLKPIRTTGNKNIVINLDKWAAQLLYSY
ncbi:MAG: hypothetical protein WC833_03785 [Bacteroidales bacterium]|jgi:hypothetical protein